MLRSLPAPSAVTLAVLYTQLQIKSVYVSVPRAVASARRLKPRSLPFAALIRRAFSYTRASL